MKLKDGYYLTIDFVPLALGLFILGGAWWHRSEWWLYLIGLYVLASSFSREKKEDRE